jgi:hypothetical protein
MSISDEYQLPTLRQRQIAILKLNEQMCEQFGSKKLLKQSDGSFGSWIETGRRRSRHPNAETSRRPRG